MKKFFSLVLALVMALSLTTVAWGADLTALPADNADGNADDKITLTDDTTITLAAPVTLEDQIVVDGAKVEIKASSAVTITTAVANAFAVINGGTLTLGENVTIESTAAVLSANGGTIIIDGATVKSSVSSSVVAVAVNGGTLTIEDGTLECTGDGNAAAAGYTGTGTINVNGGAVKANTGSTIVAHNGGTVNVTGGTVTTQSIYYYTVVARTDTGKVEISGGTVGDVLVWDGDASAIITGGTITLDVVAQDGSVTISGDAVISDEVKASDGGSVAIAGGTVQGNVTASGTGSVTVTGGTFAKDVSAYLAPGTSVVGGVVKATTAFGNTTTYQVAALTVTDSQGVSTSDPTSTDTFIKVASVTNTTTVNGKTTTTFVPAWYQLGVSTFVECDKSVADYMFTIKGVGSVYVREMAVPAAFDATPVALYTAPLKATCGMVGANQDTYIVANGKYYATKITTGAQYGLLNGNMVVFDNTASTAKGHDFNKATVETYNTKYPNMVNTVKCPDCNGIVTLYTKPGSFDGNEYAKLVTTNTLLHSYTYYYIAGAATVQAPVAGTTGTLVESAETFDAGIAMYVGMSVMAAAGSVVVFKKRED